MTNYYVPKHRVWDTKLNKMIYPDFLVKNKYDIIVPAYLKKDCIHSYYIDQHKDYNSQDDLVIMRATGLFDSNDKEIWEHDIVEFELNEYAIKEYEIKKVLNNRSIVHMYRSGCWVINVWIGGAYPLQLPFGNYNTKIKIIGNIYEHPNLAEELFRKRNCK